MDTGPSLGRRRLLIAAGAGTLIAGCASPQYVPAPAQEPPPPRVRTGDRWRYAQIDRYRREQVAELVAEVVSDAPQLRVRVTAADGRPRADEVYAAPWVALQDPVYDPVVVFRHPNPMLPRQLAVGGRERVTNEWRPPGGELWHLWTEWVDALGWERVRVPAGEFTALRVMRRIAFEHSDPFRLDCRRDETLWYAPEVNRWVQREWTGYYRWHGMRREPALREEWTLLQLIAYHPA